MTVNKTLCAGVALGAVLFFAYELVQEPAVGPPDGPAPVLAPDTPRPATATVAAAAPAVARQDLPPAAVGQTAVAPTPAAAPAAAPLPNLNGRWYGEIRGGPIDFLQFTFDFHISGSSLTGRASFPIGEGAITEGRVDGNRLSFTTVHQLAATGQTLLSRFEGEAGEREIVLDVDSGSGGRGRLTVMRIGG